MISRIATLLFMLGFILIFIQAISGASKKDTEIFDEINESNSDGQIVDHIVEVEPEPVITTEVVTSTESAEGEIECPDYSYLEDGVCYRSVCPDYYYTSIDGKCT
jgi:hypothetical protein